MRWVWAVIGWVALFVLSTSCLAQTSSSSAKPAEEWQGVVAQAKAAQQKGDLAKAQRLLEKAYSLAPKGEAKSSVAFQLAEVYEKRKEYADARRWYLQSIYDAPRSPRAAQARQKMREMPDPRRPAAAGSTAIGGGGGQRPR